MKHTPRTDRLWYDYANKRDSEQRRVLNLDAAKTAELFLRIWEIETHSNDFVSCWFIGQKMPKNVIIL
jgi:hypothetical protein